MTGDRCGNCGAAIASGAQFCMKCGADISGQRSVATRTDESGTVKPASTTRISQADLLARLRDATLGDYEILAELGRGGMATVYLAHDIQLDRKVAIKVLNPRVAQGEGMVERFRLEARTAAGLSHPHIIPIHAVRETDELVYFVMKFVVGRPLDAIIKEMAPLPIPTVRTILAKVADALGYAHRNGVVHRDIKPANIMIDSEGMPIVTDFGIAKVGDRQGLTITGTAIGTPTYMSPEQCNAAPISGASDQYSLGVLAYEMLTGRPPYEGESVVTIMFKHCHDPVPALEVFGPSVPADLAQAVIRMLQKAPADRWPAMEEALPVLRGSDGGHDDTIRTQMIEMAKGGTHAELLARLSTPRSPIPVRSGDARARGPASGREPAAAATSRGRLRWPLIAASLLVVVGAATVAVWQPWRVPATQDVATPPPVTATAATPSLAGGEPGGASAPPAAPPASAEPVAPPVATVREPAPSVAAAGVAQIRIRDAPSSVAEGESVSLRAVVLDQSGQVLPRRVRWASSNAGVGALGVDGVLRALAPGRVTVTAELDGRRDEVVVVVTPVVASVEVTPGDGTLQPGEALVLTATPRGRDGRPLTDEPVRWTSSNERVAVVSSAGRVTAVGLGATVVSATSAGRAGTAQITVATPAAAAVPPPVTPPAAVEEDPRQAIAEVVQGYARALEAKDMRRVRALYPAITAAAERRTRDALEAMEDLRVRLAPSRVTVNGTTASVLVTGEWVYRGGRLDVSNRYALERRAGGWVIVSIE